MGANIHTTSSHANVRLAQPRPNLVSSPDQIFRARPGDPKAGESAGRARKIRSGDETSPNYTCLSLIAIDTKLYPAGCMPIHEGGLNN